MTNKERAERALKALTSSDYVGDMLTMDESITDLITDLLHLAYEHEFDVKIISDLAYRNHGYELLDERD